MPATPQEEARIRADERARARGEAIDSQLAEIFQRLGQANNLKASMVTKAEFKAFEQRHEERLQEFMHQARNAFVLKREVDEKRSERAHWHDQVWVRIGIGAGATVSFATVIQVAVLLYLSLASRH